MPHEARPHPRPVSLLERGLTTPEGVSVTISVAIPEGRSFYAVAALERAAAAVKAEIRRA